MKRGQKVAGKFGTDDQGSKRFKKLLDDMGIEYWTVSSNGREAISLHGLPSLIHRLMTP